MLSIEISFPILSLFSTFIANCLEILKCFYFVAMQCDNGLEYQACGSSCPLTCSDLAIQNRTCSTEDVEGCHCPNGTAQFNGTHTLIHYKIARHCYVF